MYTINLIKSLNNQYRKYTKTKAVFPNDGSLIKTIYLATKQITKKIVLSLILYYFVIQNLSVSKSSIFIFFKRLMNDFKSFKNSILIYLCQMHY